MSTIVADTTPLNYLILIEAVDLLPRLYGGALLPPSVLAELAHPHAPGVVRNWASQPPVWLRVMQPQSPADPSLANLDTGERDSILLAIEQRATLLLMDERDGAAAARGRNLVVVGTLGVLDIAAARGWLDLPTMFTRLRQTTFRSPHRLMNTMLEQDALRKKPSQKD
jgi:predicted nucleic acid-binding protein